MVGDKYCSIRFKTGEELDEALVAALTACDNAEKASHCADRALSYTLNPPIPTADGTYWRLWDGEKYVTSEIPARSEVLPKIWMAEFVSQGLQGEIIALDQLTGPEEPTLESVKSGDFLISRKDGGILRISELFDNYWGHPIPCAGTDATIYGYLPEYPASLTVGFSADCDFVCDGVDDQVEIMAALKALPPLGGKIRFEGGTYNLSASIKVDSGLGDVEMYGDIDNQAKFVGNYSGGVWRGMFFLENVERLTVRNLILENAASVTFGLEVEGLTRGGTAENVSFLNISEAIAADDIFEIGVLEVKNCRFTGATVAVGGNFVRVMNCCFENCTTGVDLRNRGKNGMVQSCVFVNANQGVLVNQNNAVISSNVIQATSVPIYLSADKGAVVAGNTFVGANITEVEGNTYVGNIFIA